jgi:hypothetical protein
MEAEMTSRTRALSLILLLLGLVHIASPLAAQTNPKPSAKQAPKQGVAVPDSPQDPKQQALELLPLLAERIDAIKSPVWKVRLKEGLATLLATHNPEGAWQLFEQSLQILEAIPVRRARDTSFPAEAVSAFELNSLRSELLAQAAVADPQSVEALLETMASSAPTEPAEVERSRRRRSDILGLVGIGLAKDQPELAGPWIEKSTQTGLTVWTHLALETIRQQSPALADATFNRMLSLLEADPGASLQSVAALGSYLFPGAAPAMFLLAGRPDEDGHEIGFDLHSMGLAGRNPPAGDPSPELVSRYLNLAYERYVGTLSTLSSGPATAENPELQDVLASLPMAAMLRPLLAQHLPEKAANLQARLNELSRYFSNEDGTTLEKTLDILASIGDPEKGPQWQAEANPENQDSRYYDQAMNAIRQNRMGDAVAISDKVKNEEVKATIRSSLVSSQIREAIEQGQLESASAQARTLPEPSRRIPFLIQIAERHMKLKAPEPALLCLTEAEQLLDQLDLHSRLNFEVEIVERMAQLDSERAYQSTARLVEEINKSGVSKSDPSPYRDGPDLMIANSLLSSQSFVLLADVDFNAALALAQSIVRPETSIAAQLAVCRAVLSKTRQPG